jgi:hypothetical protein
MAAVIQYRVRYEDDLFAWTQEQAALLRAHAVEIRKWLKQSPSLRREVPRMLREPYADAVKDAIDETGLRAGVFPDTCPYTPADVLDEDHLPTTDL